MAAGLVQASELKEITSTEVVCRGSEEVGSQTCWTAVVALILILYIYIYIYMSHESRLDRAQPTAIHFLFNLYIIYL